MTSGKSLALDIYRTIKVLNHGEEKKEDKILSNL